MYKSISGQLLSTYYWAFVRSLLSSLTVFVAPKGRTRCENTNKPTPISSCHPSLFLSLGLHLIWIPRRYIEQNVKHSTDKYPSAIEPSGCALFLTNRFSLPINLSIGYIQRNWTGPASSASQGKWTARCTITSKKAGRKIISNLHSVSLKVLIPINWLINPRIFMKFWW